MTQAQDTASPRRRPAPGIQEWDLVGRLTARLLHHYSNYAPFADAIEGLFEAHCADHADDVAAAHDLWRLEFSESLPGGAETWIRDYLASLESVSARFRLDLLSAPASTTSSIRGRSYGCLLIHYWCNLKAALIDGVGPPAFISGAGFSGPEPMPTPDDEIPRVSISVDKSWDMTMESQTQARDRMVHEATEKIAGQLERIASAAEELGYDFGVFRNANRNVQWLFWKMAEGLSYEQIATRWNQMPDVIPTTRDTVRTAVPEMANLLGVDRQRLARLRFTVCN
jgi:hypothetical protein